MGLRLGRWLRQPLQLFPLVAETVRIAERTTSWSPTPRRSRHIYWTEPARPLSFDDIRADPERRALYYFLVAHRGIGLVITRLLDGAHVEGALGRALDHAGRTGTKCSAATDPLGPYAPGPVERRALVHLAQLPNSGDLVLFGAYDPEQDVCVCFDDQVGAHGALGGRQFWPFILTPPGLVPEDHVIEDPLDLHPLLRRYTDRTARDSGLTAGISRRVPRSRSSL